MSANELEFFQRICRAVPDGHVFPQVAMSALIEPATSRGKLYQAAFRRISQKRVDYAVLDGNFKLLAVIELDDVTHNARQDARHDAYLKKCRYYNHPLRLTKQTACGPHPGRFNQARHERKILNKTT